MAPSATVDALANALVARFLRTNDHAETLKAFIREAGLAPDVGQTSGDDTNNWTIQSLLEEKQTYDKSVSFEKYGEGSQETGLWSEPGEFFFRVAKLACLDSDAVFRSIADDVQRRQNLL
jgi:hypothetical protein